MLFEFFYEFFPGLAGLLVSLMNNLWTMVEFCYPSMEEPLNVFYELFMQL